MQSLDRETARALVESGYMPLAEYARLVAENLKSAPSVAPEKETPWIHQSESEGVT